MDAIMKKKTQKSNNFVAKHSMCKSGAGVHVSKNGKYAPRHKQKAAWKRTLKQDLS